LDAFLDIGPPSQALCQVFKGFLDGTRIFDKAGPLKMLYDAGNMHVSVLDDHDMLWQPFDNKFRAAYGAGEYAALQIAAMVGAQLTMIGLSCIYYATEQAFDGHGPEDNYIRETMFASPHAGFKAKGCHFFDSSHPTFERIAAIARLRSAKSNIGAALRHGRQYLRNILPIESLESEDFMRDGFTTSNAGHLIAWSRIHSRTEVVVVVNTNGNQTRTVRIIIDGRLHTENERRSHEGNPIVGHLRFLYHSSWDSAALKHSLLSHHDRTVLYPPIPIYLHPIDQAAYFSISLPPAGMAILA